MRPSELAGLAAFIFGFLPIDGVRAADTKITLYITGCEAAQIASDRLFEFARAEMAPRELVIATGEPVVDTAWVGEVRLCHGSPNLALITIGTPGHPIAERVLDLSDVVGEMRARTLAVALAEMFASTTPNAWAAASASAAPPPVQTVPAPAPASPIVAPRQDVPIATPPRDTPSALNRLSAGAALREYFQPATTLVGPWLSVTGNRWLGEISLLTSSKNAPNGTGTVTLNNANLALGYEVLSYGRSPTFAVRARGELGMVWASGSPTSNSVRSHSQSKAQGASALEMLLVSPIGRDLGIEAKLSSGFSSGITATSDGKSVSSTDGVFVGAQLGLFYGF